MANLEHESLDAGELTVADVRRTRLADLLARTDHACAGRDAAMMATSLRTARMYVAKEQVRELTRIAAMCAVDFDGAAWLWAELRPHLRGRRDTASAPRMTG